MTDIKVGSEWVATFGKETFAKVLLVSDSTLGKMVTYRRNSKAWDGRAEVLIKTLSETDFRVSYAQKANFFELGKTYKYPWGNRTYHVKEVYSVSKPSTADDRFSALAISIGPDDKRTMTVLTLEHHRDMVEVK